MAHWKANVGHEVKVAQDANGVDDWETDPDFVNDVTEVEGRWGSKTVQGSGHQGSLNMGDLRQNVVQSDMDTKKKHRELNPCGTAGYGGRFGVEQDRMDKSAESWNYKASVEKHQSQKDYMTGFGGKFGVQKDRQDQSALGYDHKENLATHESQRDYRAGFGGKFGVQKDRQDKSAVGWEHKEGLAKHESQQDYSKGFGGKYGVHTDRKDQSAEDWQYKEGLAKHESQQDYSKGFGGKYGVQADRKDESAEGWEYREGLSKHESQKDYSKGFGGKYGLETDKQDKSAHSWDVEESERRQKPPVKAPAPSSEKGRASGLRAKFEQLSVDKDDTELLAAQQERRKQEDAKEQARLKQMEEERLRKLREEEDKEEQKMERPPLDPSSSPGVITPQIESQQVSTPGITKPHRHIQPVQGVSVLPPPAVPHVDNVGVESAQNQVVTSPQPSYNSSVPEPAPVVEEPHDQQSGYAAYESNEQRQPERREEGSGVAGVPSQEQHMLSRFIAEQEPLGGEGDLRHPLSPQTHPMEDTGLMATAIYDYAANDVDEISFEPDDLITNIEMIDEGWWRGSCKGQYGLFPANYVELRGQ